VRRLVLALVVLNVLLIAVGHAIAPARKQRGVGHRVRVGLVFDVGGKGDKSFNDAALRGLERARDELDADVEMIQPSGSTGRETALRQLAAEGNDVVIGVGFIFSADLERMAADFPDTRFAGVDYSPTGPDMPPPNLLGLGFREEQGSFVVGAMAGMLSHSKTVGFVGGMKIPLIRKFEAGYIAGVAYACPECKVLSVYAGTEPKAFADATLGRELADAQYDAGADVIYHAAGKTGDGVLAAARARGALAIGVDSDQFDSAPCCVVASMVKRVDVAVVRTVEDVIAGRFHGGILERGLAEDGVGFVARDPVLLPPDVRARAEEIEKEIIAGRIEVPST
jgi:basic membrane protein A